MNKVYKTIWNHTLNSWVAVPETTKKHNASVQKSAVKKLPFTAQPLGIQNKVKTFALRPLVLALLFFTVGQNAVAVSHTTTQNCSGAGAVCALNSGDTVTIDSTAQTGAVSASSGARWDITDADIVNNSLHFGGTSAITGYDTGSIINLTNSRVTSVGSAITLSYGAHLFDYGSEISNTNGTNTINVGGNSYASFTNSIIRSMSGNAVFTYANGQIVLDNTQVFSNSGTGVFLQGGASNSKITIKNGSLIDSGGNGVGIGIQGGGGLITLDGSQARITVNSRGVGGDGLRAWYADNQLVANYVDVNMSGNGSTGVRSNSLGSVTIGNVSINHSGNNGYGIQLSDTGTMFLNDGNSVLTTGTNTHALAVRFGATKTFDGSTGNILPSSLEVRGRDSAVLYTSSSSSTSLSSVTLLNTSLNIGMTNGLGTWGAKADDYSSIIFAGSSSTGGTGLWAVGSVAAGENGGTIKLAGAADAAGSLVKLDGTGQLDISDSTHALTNIGALQSDSTASNINFGGNTLQLGLNNVTNNGSLVDNANYAGMFNNGTTAGVGHLVKDGALTQILSGAGNTVASVIVKNGTLEFTQNGDFSTTGNYTTQAGATTSVGNHNSSLNIGGVFTQEANSHLVMQLGASPDIVAESASLDGDLSVTGFTLSGTPNLASAITAHDYTVIRTTDGIAGDFTSVAGLPGSGGLDYLITSGHKTADNKDYVLGFQMAWMGGGQNRGTGSFTLAEGTEFTVDLALNDQTFVGGVSDLGWNGRDLIKTGAGILTLSALNTYTGSTSIEGGRLNLSGTGDISSSSHVSLSGTEAAPSVLDLSGISANSTTLNNLSGTVHTELILGGKTLVLHNDEDTVFAGDFDASAGSLTKSGNNKLVLSGQTLWTGTTYLNQGTLTLDGSANGAQLTSNIVGQSGSALQLTNGATLTGWIDPTDVNIDASSRWNMNASSQVNQLNHSGEIYSTSLGGGVFNTLTVLDNYSAQNGLVVLNSQLGGDGSPTDQLIVQGNTTGSTRIVVNNVDGSGAQTLNGIPIVLVRGQSNGQFKLENRVVAGAYEYSLFKGTPTSANGNWYLRSEQAGGTAPKWRPEVGAYLGNQYLANVMQMHTLYDRQNARFSDQNGSVWGRVITSHTSSNAASGNITQGSNYSLIHFGADFGVADLADGKLHLGAMGSYGDGRTDANAKGNDYEARGDIDGYNLGLYATWYDKSRASGGAYVDSWMQYGWYNNKVQGDKQVQEKYDSQAWSASIETGYDLVLKDNNERTFHLIPQFQAAYSRFNGDDHRESNGSLIHRQNGGTLNTRLGIRIAGESEDTESKAARPFVELNWLHADKNTTIGFNETDVAQGIPKNRVEIKMGVQGNLSKSLSGWVNIGLQNGASDYYRAEGMAGMKYIW